MLIAETPRLRLRQLRSGLDETDILALLNEPSFHAWIGDRGVRDLGDAQRYLREGPEASYARYGFGLYAVERREDGQWLGMAGLLQRDYLEAPDIGYALREHATGQGYAREAVAAVLAHAGELGLTRLLAIVTPGNLRSTRLLEEVGFHLEGLRRVRDDDEVAVYARQVQADARAPVS